MLTTIWHAFLFVTGANNLSGWIYGLWSAALPVIGAVILWAWHQQCHEAGCLRFGRHPYDSVKLCRRHHPDHDHTKPFHIAEYLTAKKQAASLDEHN